MLRRFQVGDFVYLQHSSGRCTLETAARREILRVQSVGQKGTLILQGKCGGTISVNAVNCAPCHLPGISGELDIGLAIPDKDQKCEICGYPDSEATMLLCDGCDRGYHMACLQPVVTKVPQGNWYCVDCAAHRTTGRIRIKDGEVEEARRWTMG